MSPRLRSALGAGLRLTISIALLLWLASQLRGGFEQVRAVDPMRLLPAALVFALSTVLGAWQWILLLHHADIAVPGARLHGL